MGGVTGPRIVAQVGHHAGTQRVSLDIPQHNQEMVVVLDHRTPEPALPNMADAAMAAVIAVGMRHGQLLKDAADGLARFRSPQQVNVVGH
jgi:hypothetical protein